MQTRDIVEAYYARFNQGSADGMLELLAEDVAHDINQGSREIGKEAFRRFLGHMDRCYAEQVVDLVVMVSDSGRRAAAEFVINGRYLATDEGLPPAKGQTYRLPVGAFFDLDGGLITRVTNYYNLNEWLRQIGE